ncbi:radical SAM protein [Microbispora siamensis]
MHPPIVPFRQFVLKVASRCDLACDHCYVYEHADTSWRGPPMVMSDETAARVADRIAEHAAEHRIQTTHVVFHGGEPLLAGIERIRRFSRTLRRAVEGVCDLDLRIHTNGVLLSRAFCDMFQDEGVKAACRSTATGRPTTSTACTQRPKQLRPGRPGDHPPAGSLPASLCRAAVHRRRPQRSRPPMPARHQLRRRPVRADCAPRSSAEPAWRRAARRRSSPTRSPGPSW